MSSATCDLAISFFCMIKSIKACLSVCLPANTVLTVITGSYYNRFTVRGTVASRVSFRIVAKAVRMGGHWPDFRLQGLARPKESPSASLSFAAFDLCR